MTARQELEQFSNENVLLTCDNKLTALKAAIDLLEDKVQKRKTIKQHAVSLYKKLLEIRKTVEIRKDPRDFLHTIVIIHNALPTPNNKPTKDNIDKLIALAQVSKGHPSLQWKTVGSIMMFLGAAVAIAAGIVLTVFTMGVASPIGTGLAAAGSGVILSTFFGSAGIVSILPGIGFFTYGNTRTGLSRNIMDVAKNIPQPLSP
jgi:hypothetical protein